MVKINKTLGLALLTALAASCSSDNDVTQSNPTVENNNGVAYATLRIDLPTQQGSRAVEFDDGLATEYAVNDATLLVFKKGTATSEGDYTFVESVGLGNKLTWKNVKYGGITTQAETVAKLQSASLTDARKGEYYALVILNNGTGNAQKIKLPAVGTPFSTWNNDTTNVKAANMTTATNGIVMANAPEWKKAGDTPLTLVPIDGTKVFANQTEAQKAGAAATIHVERGLAKVTMTQPTSTTVTGTVYASDKVNITGWQLDVTNKSSFPIHNVYDLKKSYDNIWDEVTSNDAPTVNRFHDMTNSFKRVYWAMDPNYSGNTLNQASSLSACHKAFNIATDSSKIQKSFDNPQYCLENTFDIENMTQGQTTRVLFQATYAPNGITSGTTFFKVGSAMYKQADLETLIYNIAKTVDKNYDSDYNTLNLGTIATKAGEAELTEANFIPKDGVTPNVAAADLAAKVNGLLNSKIATYLNGVCFYIGRIKHFGDSETPWGMVGNTDYGNDTYGGKNSNYLGRYGVVRNNWYSLSVHSVTGPGVPTPPDVIPENPDDEKDVYVNMTVKILQWAKRTQAMDL